MEQITVMTNEQLTAFAETVALKVAGRDTPTSQSEQPKRFVYGLRGISELFKVSHTTAQKYKNTFLQPAITQRGRKIIVDVDAALQLFNDKNMLL